MTHATHPDVHIPGTYMFDGKAAMKGYALNKMCYSFNSKENRDEFVKDEDAYCTKYGSQRRAARGHQGAQCPGVDPRRRLHLLSREIRRDFRPLRAGRGRSADRHVRG